MHLICWLWVPGTFPHTTQIFHLISATIIRSSFIPMLHMTKTRWIILPKSPEPVNPNPGLPGFWIHMLTCSALPWIYRVLTTFWLSVLLLWERPAYCTPVLMPYQLLHYFLLSHSQIQHWALGFALFRGRAVLSDTATQTALHCWYWFWGIWGFYSVTFHVQNRFPDLISMSLSLYICVH